VPVIEGAISVPTRGGAEAFVDAADIAAVAVETLVDPDDHAGAQYAPTGPQSLTVSDVADIIADVIGEPIWLLWRGGDFVRGCARTRRC
jgi:uncharacterized protein YbjT (DUF2867 family)